MGVEIPPLCLEKMAERGIRLNTKAGKEYVFGWTKGRVNLVKPYEELPEITPTEEIVMSGYLEEIVEKNDMIEEILSISAMPECKTYVLFKQLEGSPNPWAFGTVLKDNTLGFIHSYIEFEEAVEKYHSRVIRP